MRNMFIFAIACLIGISIGNAEPTARTYCFAAMENHFSNSLIDSLAKYFDVVITHDDQRDYNPRFRDSTQVTWRRNEPPWILLYKDAMTLIGFFVDTIPPYDTTFADSTRGGGDTPGGYWHFDSIFHGYGTYNPDTFFMMKSDLTEHYDSQNRVHAGSEDKWQWRWAMDYGKPYWQDFYGCSTKVQCLRNYQDLSYDETYFDGIFMDNLLQFVNGWGYRMFPIQYMKADTVDSTRFRNAVHAFAESVSVLYHNPTTPQQHGKQILGIANLNQTYHAPEYDSIWRRNINVLDGGMEESFVTSGCSFSDWSKFLHEISIAESLGKTCLMCHKVDGFVWDTIPPLLPFEYTKFDSSDLIFGFASYLMAFDSMACFYFTPDSAEHYSFVCRAPIIDYDFGKPMRPCVLREDNLAYRHYEEGVMFVNATDNQLTAGFSSDTLLRLDAKAQVKDTVEQFLLPADSGAICLYSQNYFHGSGFEPDDRLCWENYCLEAVGITDSGAVRVSEPCTTSVHSGSWMYKTYGTTDISSNNNFIRFKIFPYNTLIKDSTYFSFWIKVTSAPDDSVPIGLDCLLKNGERLSDWTKYGTILDQYGREISSASRRVPKGAWYQYVFTFNPAVNETIDHIEGVYDDTSSATGNFCAYIDDIAIMDSFPIKNCWHCEQFPNNPLLGDPNFYMNFISQGDSTKFIINPQGNVSEGSHWVEPIPRISNNITNITLDSTITLIWHQYDKAHSLIFSLLIRDSQWENHWLTYAKNADSCWYKTGWVNMGDTTKHYHAWESCFRNIKNDYVAEYGAVPESIMALRLEHFARSEWNGDSGGTIRDLNIVPFTQEFAINGGQNYANMRYAALWTKASSGVSIDSMNIYQDYYDPPDTLIEHLHHDSTGWIKYDSGYVWYLRAGEGNNTVKIRYKVNGDVATPQYNDNISYDQTLPSGSLVINNNDTFTNTANVTLKASYSDGLNSMSKMRYGNQYLKNVVKNSAFIDTSYWQKNTGVYDSTLKLYKIPVITDKNYFYEAIPSESLSQLDNDTMLLSVDLVSDSFVGTGYVQFQLIYDTDTSKTGQHPYGTSISIPMGIHAFISHYNLTSYFKYHPDPDKQFIEARVGIFIDADPGNKGKLYIDNLRCDVVSPYNSYSRFETYDSLKSWTLTSGNGVKKVYGQFSDGAGNETDVTFDTIIVDTTKPVRKISSPTQGQKISHTIEIKGWAYDKADPQQHFKQYELYYCKSGDTDWHGVYPDSIKYTPVSQSFPPQRLGYWYTDTVTARQGDGTYNLRLTVRDSATNWRDTTVTVDIDNSSGEKGMIAGFSNYLYGLTASDEIDIGEFNTGKIYRYDENYQLIDTFKLIDSSGLGNPIALVNDDSGKLWIANIKSQTINRFSHQGNFEHRFGGNLAFPSGIAFDDANNMWVSDRLHYKIRKFNQNGDSLFAFGEKGSALGKINEPLGIDIYDHMLYVVDSKNKRISVFDTLGSFIQVLADSAGFSLPFAIVIDSSGCFTVSDFEGNKVIEFDPWGSPLYEIDTLLDSPSCLALSLDQERLYISDTKHKRVLEYVLRSDSTSGGGPQSSNIGNIFKPMLQVMPTLMSNNMMIRVQGLAGQKVNLRVYDPTGRLVKILWDNIIISSNQSIAWDGRDSKNRMLGEGVYFIMLDAPEIKQTRKIILIR